MFGRVRDVCGGLCGIRMKQVTGMELSGESQRNKARGCVDVCAGGGG